MRKRAAAGAAMTIAALFVGQFEGRNLIAVIDPVAIPTICYGHTEGVRLGQTATQAQCDAWLKADLGRAFAVEDAAVKVPMPETRRAALASFIFNAGSGHFLSSTLLRKLNAGDAAGACDELLRWNHAGGRVLDGLTRRREAERKLCREGL